MLEQITSLYLAFTEYSSKNPVVAGLVGMWGLGVVTIILKDIPSRVWSFLKRECTTTLILNSQDKIFFDFLDWVAEKHMHSFVRVFNLNNGKESFGGSMEGSEIPKLTVGYTRIFFRHGINFFSLVREEVPANNTAHTKEKLHLTVLGRDQEVFRKLLQEVQETIKIDKENFSIFDFSHGSWYKAQKQSKRGIASLTLDERVRSSILNTIADFTNSREWYSRNGVPYRLGILLHGPPGTGKTSLIKAICSDFNKDLYPINLNGMNDTSLARAISQVPAGGVIAIEDIDACGISVKRTDKNKEGDKELTIAGILNAIDGVSSSEDHILIVTTNFPDRLDEALTRSGRIDVKLELGNATTDMLEYYLKRFYPDFSVPKKFHLKAGVPPCDLQKMVFENRGNPDKVLEELIAQGKARLSK